MPYLQEMSLSLVEFAARLGQAPDETTLQHWYLDEVDRYLPGLGAGIYLLAPDTGRVLDVSAYGVSDYFLARYEHVGRTCDPVFQGLVDQGETICNRQLMSMEDWKSSDCYQEVLHLHRIDHSMQAPVLQDGLVAGTLNFGRREHEPRYEPRDYALADLLGRLVGMALTSVRERERVARENALLRSALELVGQAVVVTDLATAGRLANPAARNILDRAAAAGTSLDELIAQPGRVAGDIVGHEMPIEIDGGRATLSSRTVRPADGIEVSFLELVRAGQQPSVQSLTEPLTPREREVAQLAASGLGDKEIAQRLYLSPHTVKGYMKACYRKLGVNSRVALARLPEV